MRRARGVVVLLCAVSLLGRLATRACAEQLHVPPPPPRCERVFRCDTGGAGFGDELEHFAYCNVVAELLNATLVLPPGSFETGSKRHCCAAEYSDVAALLGVGTGREVPAAAPVEGSAAEQAPRNVRHVSLGEARALHAAWVNGTAALPCDAAFTSDFQSCPDAPVRWCSFLPSYDALGTVRPRLQALAAGAPQRCAARGLGLHLPGAADDTPVVVLHVRTGDVCLRCEEGGSYFRRLVTRLLDASPTLARSHRLVVASQHRLDFQGDLGAAFPNATFAVNRTLASTACDFLTADVLIATGSSLPVFIAAFAPPWAPIVLEERRKEATARYAPKPARNFTAMPTHFFGPDAAVLLDDGVPRVDNATLTARIEGALAQLRHARGGGAAAASPSGGSTPAAPPLLPSASSAGPQPTAAATAPPLPPTPPAPPPPSPPPGPLPLNVSLTSLPWNTTHASENNTHVLIGFHRKNATELNGHGVTATRPNITAPWDDRPNCVQLSDFVYARGSPDVMHVSVCDGPAPPSPQDAAPAVPALEFVACVPPLHGPLNAAWLAEWLAWHAALGVQAFFIYVIDVGLGPGEVPRLPAPPGTTLHWFNVSWLSTFDTHSMGQHWAIHDCLYRNRAAAASWGLFFDIDELLVFPPLRDGLYGLVRFLESRNVSAATFGSVPYSATMCLQPDAGPRTSVAQRAVYRSHHAEGCVHRDVPRAWPDTAWRWCPNWHGRRKFIARLAASTRLDIHGVWEGEHHNSDAGIILDAERAWIKHVRGAPFAQPQQLCGCSRQQVSAAACPRLPGCFDMPDGGLNCTQSPAEFAQFLYYDDAPFLAAATAFGALDGWTTMPAFR